MAVEARRQLADFSRHFARNSLALVGFLAGYHYLQDVSPAVALAAGWAAFGLLAAALHPPRRRSGRESHAVRTPARVPAVRIEWSTSPTAGGKKAVEDNPPRKPQRRG